MRRFGKYNARAVEVDGQKFPSVAEANRWCELKLLLEAGKIRRLERQVTHKLIVKDEWICSYVSDFEYEEVCPDGRTVLVVEDVKGFHTPVYKLKRRLMKACLKIEIRETSPKYRRVAKSSPEGPRK